MGARLPWPDDAPAMAENGPFEAGVIHDSGSRQDCSIRRISSLGATLRGKIMKSAGDDISVELATGHRHAATIDWAEGGEAGIRFHQPIDVLALINRKLVSQSAERRVSNTACRTAVNVRPMLAETRYSDRSRCAGRRWW